MDDRSGDAVDEAVLVFEGAAVLEWVMNSSLAIAHPVHIEVADGCGLEAAEQVGAEDGIEVLALLARLVDRSLVGMADGADGPRYWLLESVRDYCVERLHQAGEHDEIRRRHLRYYTQLAEHAEPHLYGPGQRRWLERLDRERAAQAERRDVDRITVRLREARDH